MIWVCYGTSNMYKLIWCGVVWYDIMMWYDINMVWVWWHWYDMTLIWCGVICYTGIELRNFFIGQQD